VMLIVLSFVWYQMIMLSSSVIVSVSCVRPLSHIMRIVWRFYWFPLPVRCKVTCMTWFVCFDKFSQSESSLLHLYSDPAKYTYVKLNLLNPGSHFPLHFMQLPVKMYSDCSYYYNFYFHRSRTCDDI